MGTVTNPADPDLWHRLAVGEYLWKTHHFPLGNTFSYLADYRKVADHEWGGAFVFYGLWQWGGGPAIVVAKLVTLSVTLAFIVRAGMQDRQPTALMSAFYALVLLTLLPSFQSTLRCMVFTHIFLALWVWWFQRERCGRPVPTWLYPLSMIPWANLHGGFAIGLAWLSAVMLVEALFLGPWRLWALRLGLSLLATLVNPYGVQLWVSTARALVTTRRGFSEWAPVHWLTTPLAYPGYKLLLVCVIAGLAIQIYRRGWRNLDQPGAILIGLFVALSFTSARHTSLLAIVAGGLLPGLFPLRLPRAFTIRPLRRLGGMAVNSALIMVPLYSGLMVLQVGAGFALEYAPADCPVDAVTFLERANCRGNLLVPFNYGSYALWELRGKMRVSMDGRYDLVYKPETYRRVDDFFSARGNWRTLLTSPPPNAILVPRSADVYLELRNEPGWSEVFRDPYDAVFLPTNG